LRERAILVEVRLKNSKNSISLDELANLSLTAGAEVCGRVTQTLEKPNPRSYIGKERLKELRRKSNAVLSLTR
jgi:GTP-binding protein HflX